MYSMVIDGGDVDMLITLSSGEVWCDPFTYYFPTLVLPFKKKTKVYIVFVFCNQYSMSMYLYVYKLRCFHKHMQLRQWCGYKIDSIHTVQVVIYQLLLYQCMLCVK